MEQAEPMMLISKNIYDQLLNGYDKWERLRERIKLEYIQRKNWPSIFNKGGKGSIKHRIIYNEWMRLVDVIAVIDDKGPKWARLANEKFEIYLQLNSNSERVEEPPQREVEP